MEYPRKDEIKCHICKGSMTYIRKWEMHLPSNWIIETHATGLTIICPTCQVVREAEKVLLDVFGDVSQELRTQFKALVQLAVEKVIPIYNVN